MIKALPEIGGVGSKAFNRGVQNLQTHRLPLLLPSNPSRDREKDTREIGERLDGADEPRGRSESCLLHEEFKTVGIPCTSVVSLLLHLRRIQSFSFLAIEHPQQTLHRSVSFSTSSVASSRSNLPSPISDYPVHPPAHSARTLDRCFISLILGQRNLDFRYVLIVLFGDFVHQISVGFSQFWVFLSVTDLIQVMF